jgi:drug/metabolite transporter (DMT)-like permease
MLSEEGEPKLQKFGPAIVSVANAARAFDAPVRYPLLFSAPDVFVQPMAMPRASAFVTLIEHLFGMLILGPILFFTRGFKHIREAFKKFDRRDWISLIYVSCGGSALGLFFFLISFGLGNPTVAILIQKTQPIITFIFAIFILKEKPTKLFYGALTLAIGGVILISIEEILAKSGTEGWTVDWLGFAAIVCSLIAAVFWGGSTVFGRILTKKLHFWDLTLLRYVGGFFFLLVLNACILTYNQTYFQFLLADIGIYPSVSTWQWPVIACLVYAAVLTGGVIPLALYYFGLKRSRASIAGLAELAFPLLAIFVNYFFLGWGLTTMQGIGAGILLVTVSALSFINAREMEKQKAIMKENKIAEKES